MDAIADNTFTEIQSVDPTTDDPSLLTIILELTPGGWFNLKDKIALIDIVKSLLVFLNGHLSLNNNNQVAFIASTPYKVSFMYPNPHAKDSPSEETDTTDEQPTLLGKGMYTQFRKVDNTILQEFNSCLEEMAKSDLQQASSKLSTALSLALSYTNRVMQLDQTISTTTASAISSATNISNKESNTANGGTNNTGYQSSKTKSRILIVTPNDNDDIKYIPLMNGIFAAQKMKVPIDVAKLGVQNSSYLQQAADITNGVYLHIENPQGIIQVLSTAYFIEPSIRPSLILPTNSNINDRASCFITGKLVEIGYVCSVCLCVMSIIPASLKCPTCNCQFDPQLINRLKHKPIVKRRKLISDSEATPQSE